MKTKQLISIILSIYYCLFICSALTENDIPQSSNLLSLLTLRYVAVVSRHGSRSPLETYPNDPYPYTNISYWPNGPNQLSNLGKVQLFHTGQYLRSRYQGFIDPIYNPDAIEVTYNPYDRDYMSSALLTAGMYPPQGPQIWNSNLPWQPIVQKLRGFDVCDMAFNEACPKFKKLFNDQTIKFNKQTEKYKALIEYISINAGKNYTQLSQLQHFYDILLMQVQNGYKVPLWAKKIFPFILEPIAKNYLVEAYSGTNEQLQLAAGPELKYISDRMTMKANGSSDEVRKFYLEAAHDCTLLPILKALGNKDPYLEIKTGAFILFELHYIESDYVVQTFYFNTSYDEPINLNLDGCPNPCSLHNFNIFVSSVNPQNWEQACKTL